MVVAELLPAAAAPLVAALAAVSLVVRVVAAVLALEHPPILAPAFLSVLPGVVFLTLQAVLPFPAVASLALVPVPQLAQAIWGVLAVVCRLAARTARKAVSL